MSGVTPPNILFILSDDQGAWAMGCAGNEEVRTPNLDRLAAEGMRCENFFCTSPVCSPARASILTGRMPSAHGVHDWIRAGDTIAPYETELDGRQIEYLEGMPGYTEYLEQEGYRCGLSGKWHMGASHKVQKGHSFWKAHAKGGSAYYNWPMVDGEGVLEVEDYITDVVTDHALEFLETCRGERAPFYLGVHYTAPHSPWGREQHPAETWDDYHENCPFLSCPQEVKHPWVANGLYPADPAQRRASLSGYYAAITEMDRNIGRLLDWLDEAGLRDSTLIVFTSDNGMNMGHHGIYGKGNGTFPQNMYDSSVKVPMIMRYPEVIEAGRTASAMLSHYDLFPTFLEVAGLANPHADTLPGSSLVPVLKGEREHIRDDVVIYDEYGPVRMIRTEAWKYVHRTPYGPHELYHLKDDPEERYNLIDRPEHQERVEGMRRRLEVWFHRYTDSTMDGRYEPVTGLGQIERAGLAGAGKVQYVQRV
ncbi:MAG: sulfatase-like hydrolase/transferase [Planctomycetota bacterium]|jgi:arylsulfatase A-like enzyme